MYKHVASTVLVGVIRCFLRGRRAASVDCCVGRETATGELTTCFVLVDVRDCLIILDFKIIQFYNNYNKLIN